jgi:archaeal flagellar protein FlaI
MEERAPGQGAVQQAPEPVPQPVPQPVMVTSLLPEEAPNIMTGYARLITLGLSFFLAVYLGLEAFSLFVNFPAKLPISSVLIADGHLSSTSAAVVLLILLFGEVGAVQVWAWRTRRSSLEKQNYVQETIQTPMVAAEPIAAPVVAQPVAMVQEAPPPVRIPETFTVPAPRAEIEPPAAPVEIVAPTPVVIATTPIEVAAAPEEVVVMAVPAPVQEPITIPEVVKAANIDVIIPSSADTNTTSMQQMTIPERIEQKQTANVQVKDQEQQSGLLSQFESPPESKKVEEVTVESAPRQPPVSAPQSSEVRSLEPTVPAAAGAPFVMRYQIYPDNPEIYVGIQKDPETGGFRYMVVEPRLTLWEKQVYQKLTRLLVDELEVDMTKLKNNKSAEAYLVEEAKKLSKKYGIKVAPESYKKIAYYFTRDYIKLGKIEVLMNDPRIEDISCDGPRIPLFIWHRDYESIPTNVMFNTDEELNTFASKLAYVSGKHISIAAPIVDATLPDGSRIQITYGKEVTKKGSTFTIRKFKGDPITIVDLLRYNTLSPELGAYLWYLIERRMSLLVAGGTASGKTTTLNALSMFIPPDQKIVSVEDTPELNLSHKNWIQSISRGGGVAGEITLFDLLKAALRQRPDIIIVGEVRGVEAFTLFQAIATGHGGLGTVHADSVEAAINRLTTEPMNVPKSLLGATLDCIIMQLRIKLKDKSVRRMVHVAEIVGHEGSTDQIVLNNVFKWDPVSDKYIFGGRSRLFDKITKRFGTTPEKIRQDLDDRRVFLAWLQQQNIRDYRDVSQQIREFYSDPRKAVERAQRVLDGAPA